MKKSFLMFNNWEKIFAKLPEHLQGQLIMAIFAYAGRGELPEDIDPMVDVAFAAMQDALDANAEKYRETAAKRSESGKKGGRPKKDAATKSAEEEESKKSKCFSENPVTDTVTGTVTDIDTLSPSRSYGQYGWVTLADEEYQALTTELGEPELQRCIDYVDQCAQGNGNKNQWSDWTVILRRASQNQWGKQKPKANKKQPIPWGSGSPMPYENLEQRAVEELQKSYEAGFSELALCNL